MTRREPDLGDRESRERKHFERLGTDKPFCLLCDCPWACAIELHHIAGRKYHPKEVPLCQKHHAIASDLQNDHPAKIPNCTNPAEALAHKLLGWCDLITIALEELRDPNLATFLEYLKLDLKDDALWLLEFARRAPRLDVGLSP